MDKFERSLMCAIHEAQEHEQEHNNKLVKQFDNFYNKNKGKLCEYISKFDAMARRCSSLCKGIVLHKKNASESFIYNVSSIEKHITLFVSHIYCLSREMHEMNVNIERSIGNIHSILYIIFRCNKNLLGECEIVLDEIMMILNV